MNSILSDKFVKLLKHLPDDIKKLAKEKYLLWLRNPEHPSLDFKALTNKTNVYRIKIGDHYRAIGYLDKMDSQTVIKWFWIGTHEEYNKFIKNL